MYKKQETVCQLVDASKMKSTIFKNRLIANRKNYGITMITCNKSETK